MHKAVVFLLRCTSAVLSFRLSAVPLVKFVQRHSHTASNVTSAGLSVTVIYMTPAF